jgi:hypothetical protein
VAQVLSALTVRDVGCVGTHALQGRVGANGADVSQSVPLGVLGLRVAPVQAKRVVGGRRLPAVKLVHREATNEVETLAKNDLIADLFQLGTQGWEWKVSLGQILHIVNSRLKWQRHKKRSY